jgi:NAD(P)-dependent dehydrogenase (short-subunit alcohol dehydrogenase family)
MGIVDGKVIVIVGAGRGIGRAAALLFAKEGARVALNDPGAERDGSGADPSVAQAVAAEIRSAGGTGVVVDADVTTTDGADRLIADTEAALGRVDSLVYLAGALGEQQLARIDAATWDRTLRVHLTGALYATRAAAASMQRQRYGGRVVLTTSAAGMIGNFGASAYAAAAAGVYGLMRSTSIELQRHGIFVNAVAPLAKTRLTEDLPMFEHVDTMTPEHAAPAYLFFGSDLSGDLTGNVLGIAGGRISLFKVEEANGRFKDEDRGVWRAEEIRDQWNRAGKF